MGVNAKLYDRDFYAWTREQAALLRSGRVSEIDLENVAEEIESIGRSEKRELVSRMVALLIHLAKWRFQPAFRSRSWRLSIGGQRVQIEDHLGDNPSLRPLLDEVTMRAWRRAVLEAERETGLDASTFSTDCPWTAEQALDDGFWPE